MLLAVLAGIVLIYSLLMAIGGVVKKVVEIFSMLVKLGVGAALGMIIYQLQPFKFETEWGMLLVVLVGAALFFLLITLLASHYRFIAYSINYLINSVVVMGVAFPISQNHPVSFVVCALALLLFPRLVWVGDRRATEERYSHMKDHGDGSETYYYTVHDVDWWGTGRDAWNHMPLQIAVSSVFYLIGSLLLIAMKPIESGLLTVLFILLATAVNVCFDFFVFRRVDDALG